MPLIPVYIVNILKYGKIKKKYLSYLIIAKKPICINKLEYIYTN